MGKVEMYRFLTGTAAIALYCAGAPAVFAQSETASAADQAADRDEIVVTARFKKETLQEVPQAISAFSERTLENQAARDLSDLAPSTPNVNIQPVATFSNSAAMNIRGIGAQGIESTEESPVGISIDGVFVTRPVATLLDTFDMERVEVLRGPQGTSFGKNSLAGGIAAYSKNPGKEFAFQGEVTVGNYGRKDVKAAVDLPLVKDQLGLRLVVNRENSAGWFHNRYDGHSLGGQDRLTVRGTLLYTPSDAVTVNLKGFWVKDRSSAPGGDAVPDHSKLLWIVYRFDEPNDGPYTIGRDFPGQHSLDQWGVIGKVDVKLGSWTATSISGYIKSNDFNDSDFDQSEINFFPTFRLQSHHQFSEELRIQSDFSDRTDALARLNLVFGGYYLNQSFQLAQAFPTLPVLLAPSLQYGSEDYVTQDNTAKALFGQAIYGLTDKLNVTVGVRQSWEDKDYFRDPTGTLLSPPNFKTRSVVLPLDTMAGIADANFAAGKAFKGSSSRNRATFKAGIDYKIQPGLMVYANYSQGYKGGGYGARAATPTTAGPTDDNTSEQWEAGVKSDLLGGLMRLNLTGFITKFKKLEFGVFFPNPNVPSGQETASQNIGAATTKGFEVEAQLRPVRNFTLSANIGYLDSKYTDFCADLDGPQTYTGTPTSTCGTVTALPGGKYLVDQDYTYLKLARAPEWQVNLSAEYTLPLGSAGELTARGSMLYKSRYYNTVLNDLSGAAGDYTIVDGSLTWVTDNDHVRVMLWAKNLTNKTYVAALTPTAQFFIQRFYNAPRTYGVTLGVKY
ncbi:MAG: TonB-dependent receptor [Novosphingobium sp.]